MTREELKKMVTEIDSQNAEYVLKDSQVNEWFYWINEHEKKKEEDMVIFSIERLGEAMKAVDRKLLPSNASVGDGASVLFYTDCHAGTIIKVTPKTITIRRDKATLSPDFKPEWIVGGFAGHCINSDEQSWTYEPDENGETYTFRWSERYQSFGKPSDLRALKGRCGFYDYNF